MDAKERMIRSANDCVGAPSESGPGNTSASFSDLPQGLAGKKDKTEREREKEAKKNKKKEEKEAKKKSKSDKKKKNKEDKKKVSEDLSSEPKLAPSSFSADGWSCSACTYWNQPVSLRCEICDSARIQIISISSPLLVPSSGSESVDQRALWWYCSACTFKNLPATALCEACYTPRSPHALTEDVEPMSFDGARVHRPEEDKATAKQAGKVKEKKAKEEGEGGKGGGKKGHKRTMTEERQENDDFWVPEAEESDNDEDDGSGIAVDKETLKKLSRSDNSPAVDRDDDDDGDENEDGGLRRGQACVREAIERREREREREMEAKLRADEERRKKEDEEAIPLEVAMIEQTEFYATNDRWEDELYSEEDDMDDSSTDPVDDLEDGIEDRGRKQNEYYSEEGGGSSISSSSSSSDRSAASSQRMSQQRREPEYESPEVGAEEGERDAAYNYEVVSSTRVPLEDRKGAAADSVDKNVDPTGIDVYELAAPPVTRKQTSSAQSLKSTMRARSSAEEEEERDRQQGYTTVAGGGFERTRDKSSHYRFHSDGYVDNNDDNGDGKGKQKEDDKDEGNDSNRGDGYAEDPVTKPAAKKDQSPRGGSDPFDEEQLLMTKLLEAEEDQSQRATGAVVPSLSPTGDGATTKATVITAKNPNAGSGGVRKSGLVKKKEEDNYLEDVEEVVGFLRAEKKSKKAQLRDSLYYTDHHGADDDEESETESETESESDSLSSDYYAPGDADTPRSAPGPKKRVNKSGGVQDPDHRRAREVAEEEEEQFRLALLRTSGEDKGAPQQGLPDQQKQRQRRPSVPPVVIVGPGMLAAGDTATAPAAPGSPINPAKLAYADLASMSPVTSSRLRHSSQSRGTPVSSPSSSSPSASASMFGVRAGSPSRSGRQLNHGAAPGVSSQTLMLSGTMRLPEHSRKMGDMGRKSDRYLQEMINRCRTLLPIVSTHLSLLQSVLQLRQRLQRFEGMKHDLDFKNKDSYCEEDRQKNLIPRLQRTIRICRRANFRLYNDIGSTMPFIGTVYTSAELAVRANDSLFQISCDYLSSLFSTEELAAIYRGAILRASSALSAVRSSCHGAICAFAKARHLLRLSATELKRANDFLKRTITQRSVLDVLQSSALSLVQATRHLLVQLKQEGQRVGDSGSGYFLRSSGSEPEAGVARDDRRHQIDWLENAVRSVESRLCVEEDRGAERNWNKEFQDILDSFSISRTEKELEAGQAALLNRGQQADKLCTLAKDFVAAAKMYGKIIISEVFLPYKQKTIKPINIGGVAGGEKYIHRGILFKFAMDWEGLYGGDEYSAKVASHELKGLARYFSCAVRGLHFPLMALIDYRGFRLVASSILPISHDTLVYGSCDMGSTVKNDNKVLSKLMEKAGRQMNVKGHLAGKKGDAFLFAPTDIEGHLGRDNRFYVLDFARTFPPATPNVQTHPRGFLYQLLRPEFVFKYHKPLSSDAFSVFGKKSNATDNPEIKEATSHLLRTVIPGFANWLERHFLEEEERVLTSKLSVLLHREGINNRYLGVVRKHCRNPRLRHYLLREMIARAIKNIMRAEMRDKTKNVHWQRMAQAPAPSQPRLELGLGEEENSQEISFSMVIARFFNVVIGLEGERSRYFWDVQMRQRLEHAFPEVQLTDEPLQLSSADFLPLFERIQQLGGIRLSKQVLKELEDTPEKVIFAYPDIIKLRSRVKHMNIVEESEALSVKLTAMKTTNEHLALRMLRYSRDHYEAAVRASTDNAKTLYRLADVLKELAKREPGPQQLKLELGDSSIERFLAAYELNPTDEKVIYQTGNVACELGEAVRSAHFYAKAKECFVTTFKRGSQPHYEKEVAEKALALMEKAETYLSVVDFEGAFELFKAVMTVRPDDVLIIFLCAEICYSWAHAIGDCSSSPYKKAIKFYQMVVDIARKTGKTASPNVEALRRPADTHTDPLSKRPRLPFLTELEGMNQVLSSSPDTYEKFLSKVGSKTSKHGKNKKSKKEKEKELVSIETKPSERLASKGIGGSMQMLLSTSELPTTTSSGSEASPASSPSPSGTSSSSSRRTWHEKRKEKKEQKKIKKHRRDSVHQHHQHHEEGTSTTAEGVVGVDMTPPPVVRRLSLKLPRSPRGGEREKDVSAGVGGDEPHTPKHHANSAPHLLPTPHPGAAQQQPPPQSPPSHHSHHLVSKLFSSTKLFSSKRDGLTSGGKGEKWHTGDHGALLATLDSAETERRKKEAEELEEKRKQEEKEREIKRQRERERERRERDPWRCIYVLFRLRLAFYNDLTRSFPGLGMFWLKMGHILVQHVHEATLTQDLQPDQEKEYLVQAAAHYAKALTLNPNYVGVLQEDHDSSYITDDGDARPKLPPRAVEALYGPVRDILQVAQTSNVLQVEIGNACHKLQMRKLFLAPVAPQISDPTFTAIIKGGSGGVPLPLEELSLSCCAEVSGNCLESLAPYLANTLTTLRLKGLTSVPTQQFCNLIKSCKKLQQLSMPHCCYRDTYMPLQTLSSHCRSLNSLDFGVMCIVWKDDFEQLARSSQGLTGLDLYYLHNLTSSIVDRFLSECKHLRRLRLPCLTPSVVKRSGKRRAKDGDVDKQRIEGGSVSYSDEVFKKWALKYSGSFANLEELHMDGYSNLTFSSMLPLVETFRSLRVLHLENNRGLDDRCLIQLTSHCTSLTTLHLAHCVNIGDTSLIVVARTCTQLNILNVALTKIGGKGVEAIAQHCRQLRELSLGCPFRLRDDLLKNLIYTSFINLEMLALFEAAEAQFRYSISAARTKGIQVEIDRNTMLPAYVAKKCPEANKTAINRVIRRISSEDTTVQVEGLRALAYDHFVPFDSPEAEDNKRYFAKMGGIPRLLDLMGPANRDQVRIKATSAVWNFAGSEELQRLLLGEGVLGPIIRSLHSVIPELQQAGVGALWPYLEFEDVGEKALELGAVEALLHILDSSKLQLRWHMLGCLVSIAENVNCAQELMAKGTGRKILLNGYSSSPDELLITRYLSVVALGFLSLDGSLEDELISDGALEQIQNFIFERHPNEVARSEDSVTNDQGVKWKFIRPFLRLTYSRHLPVQRLGAFALATLSKRPVNVKTMVDEGLLGSLVCLSWSYDTQLRQLVSIPLQAIRAKYAATIGKSVSIVPTLEQIAIHTIQHDGNLCGLKAWLSSPERPQIPEALKQRMEVKVLLASRQNLDKKVVYRGGPLA